MSAATTELANESFMSADDLRSYMTQMQMAKASSAVSSMEAADKARKDLIKTLSEPIKVTPEFLKQVMSSLTLRMKKTAETGQSELMVMRFPTALCTDGGRAINNNEAGWPDTLTGRPRQAYELWRDHLRAGGFRLKAMIIEWPGGLPGDVGFFLAWGESRQ
ncbi:hypothetical protein NK718_05265 [Alsobacter sp. SYSU M60028]|uniref:Histidine kinase n=1 Tax=Alsobacter ponti TaxID=2962936 RepID=A0ABT1L9Z2_9HYPH|nr:hypothetical protein [Alsobacter ponti]MCP8937916.1 hypothetical protein [Alsobacter ponti]